MIGDVSLLSGHVVTSLSRFVAFLLSVGVRSQDVELFAAHSLRAGGATAAAIGQLSQHSLPTADTAADTCGPSHPTAHDLPTVLPTPQPTNLPTDLATDLLTVLATPSPTCRRRQSHRIAHGPAHTQPTELPPLSTMPQRTC